MRYAYGEWSFAKTLFEKTVLSLHKQDRFTLRSPSARNRPTRSTRGYNREQRLPGFGYFFTYPLSQRTAGEGGGNRLCFFVEGNFLFRICTCTHLAITVRHRFARGDIISVFESFIETAYRTRSPRRSVRVRVKKETRSFRIDFHAATRRRFFVARRVFLRFRTRDSTRNERGMRRVPVAVCTAYTKFYLYARRRRAATAPGWGENPSYVWDVVVEPRCTHMKDVNASEGDLRT